MKLANTWRFAVALSALLAVAGCAVTAGKVSQKQPVTPIDAPAAVALDGYDPVAYFVAGAPTQGQSAIEYTWRGARWQFASESNRSAFAADPERYAPQYGGYCAYAMAHGNIARGNPFQWAIVGGKLYVNNNAFAMNLWDKDRPGHIVAADANWPLIPKLPPAGTEQIGAR
jgi:YHS domain-containing protein